jgi:hypothetical protein
MWPWAFGGKPNLFACAAIAVQPLRLNKSNRNSEKHYPYSEWKYGMDDKSTPQDLLHRLPTELLIEILKHCSDFTSLWSLIHVSRHLQTVCHTNAVVIFNAVLSSSLIPAEIRSVMWGVLCVRAGSFQSQTLAHAAEFAVNIQEGADSGLSHLIVLPGLRWKFVRLTHRIHSLAHSCIDSCLQSCSAFSTAQPASLGPPSWTEEQRALLAFWRMQFFFELKVASFRRRLDWPPGELTLLNLTRIKYFYQQDFVQEQILTALDFIEGLRASDISPPSSGKGSSARDPSTLPFLLPNPPQGTEYSLICGPHPSPPRMTKDK